MSEELFAKVVKAKSVFVIGNGGSYANAMHMVNDLLGVGICAHTMDPATLTAFANDYGYGHAYEKWLKIVGHKGDLLIALSGSGRSKNILLGVERAKDIGMDVWTEFGAAQGLDMQEAEEAQVKLGHQLRTWIELMKATNDPH